MTTTSRMPDAEWVDVDQYDENLVKGILFRIATKKLYFCFCPSALCNTPTVFNSSFQSFIGFSVARANKRIEFVPEFQRTRT